MREIRWGVLFFVALYMGALPGCSQNNDRTHGAGAPALPPGDGNLYVVNGGTGSLLAFDQAETAEGNLSPDRHFPETIVGPTGLFLDQTTDTLYVANTGENAVLIYENASALKPPAGLASATRVLSGPKTKLRRPNAVAYDPTRQRLYISNEGNSSIVVFQPGCSGAPLLHGDIAPCGVLSGASTLLASPGALAVDSVRDLLYISNGGTNTILVYENASQSSTQGDLSPTRTILLNGPPSGLFIDSARDRLYAAQGGEDGQAAILLYENASTRSGQSSPDGALTGPNTLLVSPAGIDVDATRNVIYVVNNAPPEKGGSALLIFSNPFTQCTLCDVAPHRKVTGDQTGLSAPSGLAVDFGLGRMYVANRSGNTISLFGLEGNIAPIKVNAGIDTALERPVSSFYDSDSDRLYVVNTLFSPPITIYNQVSSAPFSNTPPSWGLTDPSLFFPRAVYLDKNRGLLLMAHWGVSFPELRIYNLNTLLNTLSNTPPGTNVSLAPHWISSFTAGLNRPEAMAVDQGKGAVYISNDGNQSVSVYDLSNCTAASCPASGPTRVLSGGKTEIVRPFGLFIDTTRDILYVTDVSSNRVLAFEDAGGKTGDIPPDRVLSSKTIPPADKLLEPTAPFMNVAQDRLFLINRGSDAIYLYDKVSTLHGEVAPNRKIIGSNTRLLFSKTFDFGFGTLWVDTTRGEERLFLGGPLDSSCTGPLGFCTKGALLLFYVEGNRLPSQVWSGGEHRLVGPSALAVDPRRDLLYVANPGDPAVTSDDSITLFTKASRSDGNLPLTGTVSVTEGISTVIGIETAFNSELIIGDQIKIGSATLIVSSISSDTSLNLVAPYPEETLLEETMSGLIALRLPRVVCSPVGTACVSPDTKFNNPAGLFVDSDQNRLYVSNAGTDCADPAAPCNSLLVFHAASDFNFDAVPNQVITSDRLNRPRGLAVDLKRQTLFVANHGHNSVLVFKNVEDLNGEADPDAEIGGVATGIDEPIGVAIDPERDLLYILNEGTSEILVFENASGLDGDSAPARTLSGNFMQTPSALFLDVEGDLLYVADREADAVHIFTDASQADGEAAHKTITGVNTGLNQPAGLAVDTAR